jgi:hypothetical protein
MAWFTRFTRYLDVHLVYGQEANQSCGIASVMMCIFKINKLKPGKTALTIETDIRKRYEAYYGQANDFENWGTYPQHLASILNEFTSGGWAWHTVPVNDVPQRIIDYVGVTDGIGPTLDVTPVILGVDWDLGGAHWVVCDTIRESWGSQYATICDPWDTNVHFQKMQAGTPFVYDASGGGFMVNFGGTNKGEASPYSNTSKGMVKTWGMIYPN